MTAVRVGVARDAAIEWVTRHGRREPHFRGAFFTGSTNFLSDGVELPPASDVDVIVVLARHDPPAKLGKFLYRGVLLDVSYLNAHRVSTPDNVLASYHLAGCFRDDNVISDPTGHLSRLNELVARDFAERKWVLRRCEDVRTQIDYGLRGLDESVPFTDALITWLFATGKTAHLPLVAALRNPTVRLRYVAARDVLDDYDLLDIYPDLLETLGCVHLSRARVAIHLRALEETFDAAVAHSRGAFFFSTDISPVARAIAIDASHELIDNGLHREAMFWILVTFARCHAILAADAPRRVRHALIPAFEAAANDLRIGSTDDILDRTEEVRRFLPRIWDASMNILTENPAVRPR